MSEGPMLVKDWDVRLSKDQFDEHANREHIVCSPSCALDFVQDRGGDVSKASGGRNDAFVPHVGGEPGYGHALVRIQPKQHAELRQNGARCRHCTGVV